MPIYLVIVYGWFNAVMSEVSSYDRDYLALKA